ncbi:class I SAM-dependent methyltransferase [Bacillus sp. JJ722]|uniref:class I SAM-dependent methyltransferase n=1 Tax=Bacillus sp. JJ722 TaxID=3122973 RepID=UPI002FFF54DB
MERILKLYMDQLKQPHMTYREYMEFVLYHPTSGYYNRNQEKIGVRGDFYTSSNISDVFGSVLGRWFLHLFATYDIPLHIIEIGAGTGRITHAVLSYIQTQNEQLYKQLQYTVIERSTFHLQKQREILENYDHITYMHDLDNLDELKGIVFSNELFDAFPVHVIEQKEGMIYEVMVAMNENDLVERYVILQNKEIEKYLETYRIELIEGQRIEIPLPMMQYYHTLCNKITRGILVTIDYGYTNEQWKESIHRKGSLRGYYQHHLLDNVLQKPGEMDITTHIHWDTLQSKGNKHQMQTVSFQAQTDFLVACGILEDLRNSISTDPFSPEHKRNRAIRSLIQPGEISSHFQVLIQMKHLEMDRNALFPISKV